MKNYKSQSGNNIVFIDHSTSGIGASLNCSYANPTEYGVNIMSPTLIFTNQVLVEFDENQLIADDPEANALMTMLASEDVLRRDWDDPEEDALWADL
jgi:hypothetical protein